MLAATNRVDMIDRALLRLGRFDKIVFVPKPDKMTRESILELDVKHKSICYDVNLKMIAEATEGFMLRMYRQLPILQFLCYYMST